MKRRHRIEASNRERWMVSYADFITLLFAFFVVMYAMSSVNEAKYRTVTTAIEAAFKIDPKSLAPIQVGQTAPMATPNQKVDQHFSILASQLKNDLQSVMGTEQYTINVNPDWIEINLPSSSLFDSASASLGNRGDPILMAIVNTLRGVNYPLRIEGFTDDVPIKNEFYPSNWDLSCARATAIARFLITQRVNENRLSAVGFGANFPIADNATEVGRNQNRRVNILIQKHDPRVDALSQHTFSPLMTPIVDIHAMPSAAGAD